MRPIGCNQATNVYFKKKGRVLENKIPIASCFLLKENEIAFTVSDIST